MMTRSPTTAVRTCLFACYIQALGWLLQHWQPAATQVADRRHQFASLGSASRSRHARSACAQRALPGAGQDMPRTLAIAQVSDFKFRLIPGRHLGHARSHPSHPTPRTSVTANTLQLQLWRRRRRASASHDLQLLRKISWCWCWCRRRPGAARQTGVALRLWSLGAARPRDCGATRRPRGRGRRRAVRRAATMVKSYLRFSEGARLGVVARGRPAWPPRLAPSWPHRRPLPALVCRVP